MGHGTLIDSFVGLSDKQQIQEIYYTSIDRIVKWLLLMFFFSVAQNSWHYACKAKIMASYLARSCLKDTPSMPKYPTRCHKVTHGCASQTM